MRRILIVLSLPAAVAALGLAGGCSGNSAGKSDASADGSGVIVGGGDTGSGDAPADGTGTPPTTMRLAHASSGLGPIDFCWRSSGTETFTGPVLAGAVTPTDAGTGAGTDSEADASEGGDAAPSGDAAAPDASLDAQDADLDGADGAMEPSDAQAADAAPPAASLTFGSMTADVTLPTSGTFDIAVVAAGQTSCLQHLLVGQVTIDAGEQSTVVVMGVPGQDGGPSALTMAGFVDDSSPIAQSARVRFIHAALGSSDEDVAAPLSISANETLLAALIDPGKATSESTTPAVDSLGYTTASPISMSVSLELAAVGDASTPTTWTSSSTALGLQAGTVHTGIVVSLTEGALGVAWCGDVVTAGGVRPVCTLLTAAP
jgi:hypothetical protein